MGEYQWRVEKQRKFLAAEEWATTPKCLHAHSMDSMWYETDETRHQVKQGVLDIQYNGGYIERHDRKGKIIHIFGKKMNREELIRAFDRSVADERS